MPSQNKRYPVSRLREIASYLWKHEGHGIPEPVVVAGRGFPIRCRLASYCTTPRHEGEASRIVLARNERTLRGLTHELAHALGHYAHDESFYDTQVSLLARIANDGTPC